MIVRGALYVAHDEPGDGDLRPALSAGPRGVRGQPRARRGARLCGLGGRRRGARRRPLGRLLRSAQDEAVEPRTLVNLFSVTKALSSACLHRLVDQGRLDLDAPLWPHVAGDRTGRQRGAHRRARAVSTAAAPRAQRAARPRGVLRLGRDDERARRAGAVVGAGDPSTGTTRSPSGGWLARSCAASRGCRSAPTSERRSTGPPRARSPRSALADVARTCAAPTSRTRRGRRGA
jgi:hypothetical protein